MNNGDSASSKTQTKTTSETVLEPVLDVLTATHAIATEADAASQAGKPPKPVRNSAWRANRVLGKVVPPLLLAFILNGAYYVNAVLRPYLRLKRSDAYYICYLTAFNGMLFALVTLFLLVYFTPSDHSAPPSSTPSAISNRSVPYECTNKSGDLVYCWQDECNGRWLPPRVRHCKDCRRCRIEFDHCCPWFGTCIARDTLKGFILFLATVAPTISLGLWEVTPIAMHHRRIVMAQLWDSERMHKLWWKRWYTWIGGPVFRWGGGLVLCYWHYDPALDAMNTSSPPVSFVPILYTVWGNLLSVFCVALVYVAVRNILVGGSTIDSVRAAKGRNSGGSRSKLVWLPDTGAATDGGVTGRVVAVPAKLKLYDHGKWQNWKRVFGESLLEWITPAARADATDAWTISQCARETLQALSSELSANQDAS